MSNAQPSHHLSIRKPPRQPRLDSPQETTSNPPHAAPPSKPLQNTAPEKDSGSTYNTNNSSGTLNRVTGDQRFDASSTSTLFNCEGTSIQLVVIPGEAAAAAHATGQALPRGDGDRHDYTKCTKHGTDMQRLQARAEELIPTLSGWRQTEAAAAQNFCGSTNREEWRGSSEGN
ncbi:hypothetical protein AB1N83_006146 [Pleurotus pulmonarius]